MIDTERLIRKAAAYGIDAAPVVRKLDEYCLLYTSDAADEL